MTDQWPQSWTRAAIEMCVLAVVRQHGPTHGYEIAQRLRDAGLGEIKGGTLYPVLGRLEQRGQLSSEWIGGVGGPGRKLVDITDEGGRALDAVVSEWMTWVGRVVATVGGQESTSGGQQPCGQPQAAAPRRLEP
ncbi:PadR family transcriptional regulator [Phytoactinopolyspora endophytica]|uniref:PadR family transcriptional regulator n=1 Tax=Phytoactinopolyspora endophytica TaxID=1642495 RepID=UPI00197C349B|nr:PadR family transcriptional regulator [Phytoactinopolyspora endophytica]